MLFIPPWFLLLFLFFLCSLKVPRSLTYLLAAPGDPSVLSEQSPTSFLSRAFFSGVCGPFDACVGLLQHFCLFFRRKLDMNYSHKLILSKYCQKERFIVWLPIHHAFSYFTRYYPLILPTNLSSLFYRWEQDLLKCRG